MITEVLSEIKNTLLSLAPGRVSEWNRHAILSAQTEMLYEIVRAMSSSMGSVDKTHKLIVEAVTIILQVERSVLMLIEPKTNKLVVSASSGLIDDKYLSNFDIKVGSGVIGEVAKTGHPIWVKDVNKETKLLKKELRRIGSSSFMVAPVKINHKVLGVIIADSKTNSQTFIEADLKLLSVLADLAAIAEETAKLIERLETKAEKLKAICVSGKMTMDPKLKINERLDIITEKAMELTHASTGAILLIDEPTKKLFIRSAKGLTSDFIKNFRVDIGEGITGLVAKECIPLLIPIVKDDSRYISANSRIQSELAVPLKLENKVIGVLNVESYEPNAFGLDDQEILETFACAVTLAIKHAIELH